MNTYILLGCVLVGALTNSMPASAQFTPAMSKSSTASTANKDFNIKKVSLQSQQQDEASPLLVKQTDLTKGLSSAQAARFEKTMEDIRKSIQATDGGIAGGGGNEKEGNFVSLARILFQHLSKNELKTSEALGINLSEFQVAIDRTEVHCAINPELLSFMRELKKVAFFTTHPFRINLDCENYELAKKNKELGPIVIFHEYMRTIGRDTSSYETSSKLPLAFSNLTTVKEDLLIDPAVIKCYESFSKYQRDVFWSGYLLGVSHQLGLCLQNEGLTRAANPSLTGLSRIQMLSSAVGKDLTDFNRIIISVLKRP